MEGSHLAIECLVLTRVDGKGVIMLKELIQIGLATILGGSGAVTALQESKQVPPDEPPMKSKVAECLPTNVLGSPDRYLVNVVPYSNASGTMTGVNGVWSCESPDTEPADPKSIEREEIESFGIVRETYKNRKGQIVWHEVAIGDGKKAATR